MPPAVRATCEFLVLALWGVLMTGCAASPPVAHPAGRVFRDCPGCPDMVVVAAGRFVMGADGGEPDRPEGPPHAVTLAADFALGRYEVTQGQFERFVAATGYAPGAGCRVYREGAWENVPEADWRDPGYGRPPAPDEPVGCVSWRDAVAYADWLSARTGERYRLPTEAEWEYAARAGTVTPWFWGEQPGQACGHANVYDLAAARVLDFPWPSAPCDDGATHVAPVGRYAANAFGLHDMIGNVWEWTADCYQAPYPAGHADGSPVEAEGACGRRSVRGGSWITRMSRNTATFRGRDPETAVLSYFGFRVARDLERPD